MKNITSIAILITVSITSSCCYAQAKDGPGFDCTKASNVVEKTICASSAL
jgi:uncharacterized protein